jgi:hypothetical protein
MSLDIQRLRPRQVAAQKKPQPLPVQRLTPQKVYQSSQEDELPGGETYSVLGTDADKGYEVTVSDLAKRNATYILGKPGMGKTTLMVNMAHQDMLHGHGVFYIDPHGDAIADLLARLPLSRKDDVILLNPENDTHSFCINLLACENLASLKERTRTYNRVYSVFHKLFADKETGRLGPWLQKIISNTIYTFIENQPYGYTLAHVPDFLNVNNAAFRQELVRNIRYSQETVRFWKDEFDGLLKASQQREQIQPALDRINELLVHDYVRHVIGYQQSTIDFRKIMAEKKIVLVTLSEDLAEDMKELLGTILVSELLKATRNRANIPRSQRHQFCIYVDEFQNFATPDFAAFITGARKFGVAITIAHQERYGQLGIDRRVLGATLATGNQVFFQTAVHDAEVVAKELADRPDPAELELISEETLRILQEESETRTMDEWEDGVEPVRVVSESPLDLLAKGHASSRVSALIGQLLEPLDLAQEKAGLDSKVPFTVSFDKNDGVTYHATREQLLKGKALIDRLLADLMQERLSYDSQECIDRMVAIAGELRGFIPFTCGDPISLYGSLYGDYWTGRSSHEHGRSPDEFTENIHTALAALTTAVVESALSKRSDRYNQQSERDLQEAMEAFQDALRFLYNNPDNEPETDSFSTSTSFQTAYEETLAGKRLLPPRYVEGDEKKAAWMTKYNKLFLAATERTRKETQALVKFLARLYALCIELSQPENRIMVQSGQHQPHKHQQPHYTHHSRLVLPISRREILHPQRSYADMDGERAHDLVNLATYTAYYKLTGAHGTDKGRLKGKPLSAPHDPSMRALLKRHIQKRTLDTYYVERTEIDAAIRERQDKALNNQIPPTKQLRQSEEPKPDNNDTPQRRGRK